MIATPAKKPPITSPVPYPRTHLLTAGTLLVFLVFVLIAFPSTEVEAKRSHSLTEQKLNFFKKKNSNNSRKLKKQTTDYTDSDDDTDTTVTIAEITVSKGDTLSSLFAKVGLGANTLNEVLRSDSSAKRFLRLNVGQSLKFNLDAKGALTGLYTQPSPLESLSILKSDKGFSFERKLATPKTEEHYAHGIIEKSLLEDANTAGLSYGLAMNMARLFNYDIDFARDTQQGDEFELIYQRKLIDGKEIGNGHILAARFINRGKTYTAVRHVDASGTANYYRADGSNPRKAFIRTPVDFTRISSRFSLGRKHPILNRIRAHRGVDYAAAQGTPIKATGSGKVAFAGRSNGYGNYILIQHGNRYQTLYGHMRGFAKGMHRGTRVQQGQIIGYVGMTGLATGPHLHYEFRVGGVHVDPLSHKLPTADPISGKERQRFLQYSQPLFARMDSEKTHLLAMKKP